MRQLRRCEPNQCYLRITLNLILWKANSWGYLKQKEPHFNKQWKGGFHLLLRHWWIAKIYRSGIKYLMILFIIEQNFRISPYNTPRYIRSQWTYIRETRMVLAITRPRKRIGHLTTASPQGGGFQTSYNVTHPSEGFETRLRGDGRQETVF